MTVSTDDFAFISQASACRQCGGVCRSAGLRPKLKSKLQSRTLSGQQGYIKQAAGKNTGTGLLLSSSPHLPQLDAELPSLVVEGGLLEHLRTQRHQSWSEYQQGITNA
jgi:hypothetical protein